VTGTAARQYLLPPEAYFADTWFEREQALFERTWYFVGPEADVPAGGAPLVVDVGRCTVAIRRRGAGFVAERTDGGAALVDSWGGFLFVHATPALAGALAAWLGDLPELIGAFRPERLKEVGRRRFEVAANWKFYVENHIDMYHLWYLHERSLGDYAHHLHEWHDCAPHWSFYEPPRPGVGIGAQHARGFLPITGIGPERWGSGAHLVFPNMPLATGGTFFITYQCIPRGPEHTTIDLRVRAEPGDDHDVDAFIEMTAVVLDAEDGAACEHMQAAVRSPAFAVGPLAGGLELPITRFHGYLLEELDR
jgi:phenylpropionate dioxygenase-like ring-hydroxylating dioxygenase large terminal subunit